MAKAVNVPEKVNESFNTPEVADGSVCPPEAVMAVCPPEDVMAIPETPEKALPKKVRKPKTKKTPAKSTKDMIIAQLQAENEQLKKIIASKDQTAEDLRKQIDGLCKVYTDKTEYAMDMLTTCFKSIYREFKGER